MENIIKVGVGLYILNKKSQLLLGLRKSSHGKGCWAPPGGHIEFKESNADAAVREAKEETGLDIDPKLVKFAYASNDYFKESGKHYITLHLTAYIDDGIPKIMEPEKCECWQWFDLGKLPDNLFSPAFKFLSEYDLRKLCS